MFKKYLLIILFICLFAMPQAVFAHDETNTATDIKEDITPESPTKDINNNTWFYLTSFVVLGACVYLIQNKSTKQELKLNVDSIESNNDGSYIISFGYDNPKETIAFDEGECGIKVVKGKAIILKQDNTNKFKTGLHKKETIAVINEDSEIEYYAGSKKISIKGKDIKEKEEEKNV